MSLDCWVKYTTVFSNVAVVAATIFIGIYSVRAENTINTESLNVTKQSLNADIEDSQRNLEVSKIAVVAQFAPLLVGTDMNAQTFGMNSIIAAGIPEELCSVILNRIDTTVRDRGQALDALNECLNGDTLTPTNLHTYTGPKLAALINGLNPAIASAASSLIKDLNIPSDTQAPQITENGTIAGSLQPRYNVFVASTVSAAEANNLVDSYNKQFQSDPNFKKLFSAPDSPGYAFRCVAAPDRPGAEYGVAVAVEVPLEEAGTTLKVVKKYQLPGFIAHTAESWKPFDPSSWNGLGQPDCD